MDKNIHNLQILRGFAATAVVYNHTVSFPVHSGTLPDFGSFGVDIFFCLSGFVMAMLVQNGEKPLSFMINRFIRIAPIYWIFTSLIMVLTIVKPDLFNVTSSNWENYFKSLSFIPYFKENGSLHPMLSPGWTLNYEMYFYLCVAIAIGFSRKYMIIITTFIILLSYLLLGKLSDNAVMNKFIGNEILFEFIFGIFIFYFWQKTQFSWLSQKIAFTILILGILAISLMEIYYKDLNRAYAFGIPAAIILIASLKLEGALNPNAAFTKALVEIGNASYATYITHFFIVLFVKKIIDAKYNLIVATSPAGVVFCITISLIIGQLAYIWLDKPINSALKRLNRTRFLKESIERP